MVHVMTKQNHVFKTQYGEKYGPNTQCTINFKVIWTQRKNCTPNVYQNGALWLIKDVGLLFGIDVDADVDPGTDVLLFQKHKSCPKVIVNCPEFDLMHNKASCKGAGDLFLIGRDRWDGSICCIFEIYIISLIL